MGIQHRLTSRMDIRFDDGAEISPKRIIVLSVEGSVTEREYFDFVEKYRSEIGIDSLVHVLTLAHDDDTASDPQSVYELLQEYLKNRKTGILPKEIFDVLTGDSTFSVDDVKDFLEDKVADESKSTIVNALALAGIDYNYCRFLEQYKGSDGNDVFGIVIDRDKLCHTEATLNTIFDVCKEDNCQCFLTTPCFELWLLLHFSDVSTDYGDHLSEILENQKVSNKHTYVSKIVSQKGHHSKDIPDATFKAKYLPNIRKAITNCRKLEQDNQKLLNSIGSSLPKLFEILGIS